MPCAGLLFLKYQNQSIVSIEKNKEKLISIEEFIARAKRFGIDLGNGDPKNRLRYYVKIGLLPHAQRKSFNGLPPNGAYPEKVLDTLFEIDRQLKQGKTIQELKREKQENFFQKDSLKITVPFAEERNNFEKNEFEKSPSFEKETENKKFYFLNQWLGIFSKTSFALKAIFLFLIFASFLFAINLKTNLTDSFSYFAANVFNFERLAQAPLLSEEEIETEITTERSFLSFTEIEPYLTINAETLINDYLKVKEKISAPSFALVRDEFEGLITATGLTSQREYNFPDASGTVCLTTGNCIGMAGEVISPGGTTNRLTKFISDQEIADSSIADFYSEDISIFIDEFGNIGIGTITPQAKLDLVGDFLINGNLVTFGRFGINIDNPEYDFHIDGNIQATGDICTDLAGGRCLSTLPIGGGGGVRGVGGSGTAGYFPIWTAGTALGNSLIYQTDGNIGINTLTPSQRLDVEGIIRMTGFQMPTGASSTYILTSDEFGFGTWQPASSIGETLPLGTSGQTLRHDGTGWVSNSFLYNTGSAIGIGNTLPLADFHLTGSALFEGPLTIRDNSPLGQLVLRYNDENNLSFILTGNEAEISASSTLVINSLTGEVKLGPGVNLFDGSLATIDGATFLSQDATVRKAGEMIFRGSSSIFRYPVVSQTASTEYHRISRQFQDFSGIFPDALDGTTRRYAFLINSVDDIGAAQFSEWRVYRANAVEEYSTFVFPGFDEASFEEGMPRMSDFMELPSDDWQLEVRVPAGRNIRIFNIMLLAYDQVN